MTNPAEKTFASFASEKQFSQKKNVLLFMAKLDMGGIETLYLNGACRIATILSSHIMAKARMSWGAILSSLA